MHRTSLVIAVCLLTAFRAFGQQAEAAHVVRDFTKHDNFHFPERVSGIINVQFGKLSDYYAHPDGNLPREKPYLEFLKCKPFGIYIEVVRRKDTVTVLTYLLPKVAEKDVMAVFDHVQKAWESEDGLVFPVYDEMEVKRCPVNLRATQHLWFELRYI
jgi:hypothetical protein